MVFIVRWLCRVFQIMQHWLCGYHSNKQARNVEQNERKFWKVEDVGRNGGLASAVRRNHESRVTVVSRYDDLPYSWSRGKERRKPACMIYRNKHVGGADKKEMYLWSCLEGYSVPQFSILWSHRKTTWQKAKKLNCTLVQALRLCTGRTAHRGNRGIALLFLGHGTRRGWVVSVMPWPLFTPGKDPVPIVQEAGWAPGPVSTGAENFANEDIFHHLSVGERYYKWVYNSFQHNSLLILLAALINVMMTCFYPHLRYSSSQYPNKINPNCRSIVIYFMWILTCNWTSFCVNIGLKRNWKLTVRLKTLGTCIRASMTLRRSTSLDVT